MSDERLIDLNALKDGMPALTSALGRVLAESAAVCLENQGHLQGSILKVHDRETIRCVLVWPKVTKQMLNAYNDLQEATEWGATGVAAMMLLNLEGFQILQRSRKKTGFDYWIGPALTDADFPFTGMYRLEVSGILEGTDSQFKRRVKQKLEQTRISDDTDVPAIAVVVEFGVPQAKAEKR